MVEALPPGAQPSLAVVLCHGLGARATDLAALADGMCRLQPALLASVRFVFPAAPLPLAATGWTDGRAWWLPDVRRIAAAGGPAGFRELAEETPQGFGAARRALLSAVDATARASALPLGRVVLGGFSQGAMMATDVALRLEEAPAALLLFSGALVARPEWERHAARRRGLRVFQSHGRGDPLLPFASAAALRELLAGAGLDVDFLAFDGGHAIPPEAVRRAAALVAAALAR